MLKRVAVTGGAGQIAYSLIFRIARGELLGSKQLLALHLLDLPEVLPVLQGVKMELEDCALPLLQEIKVGSRAEELFEGVDYALLVGAKPRGAGMERKSLLGENGKIFVEQGKALDKAASREVKVIVVGNPCNTNCLIAMHHAPNLPRRNFHAMTRLDQNRATFQLAQKAKVAVEEVSNALIWGNHSNTQVPDFLNAKIRGKSAAEFIADRNWLEKEFFSTIQKRGAAIIAARGKSSAASAANAILDSCCAFLTPTAPGDWFSAAVDSTGNPYGIAEGLIFSFPCRQHREGNWEIVPNLKSDPFLQEKIVLTQKELLEERDLVASLLR